MVDRDVVAAAVELMAGMLDARDENAFHAVLSRLIGDLIPADVVAVNRVAPRRPVELWAHPPHALAQIGASLSAHAPQHPMVRHFVVGGQAAAVRMSDLLPQKTFEASELYADVYASRGLRHVMSCVIEGTPTEFTALSLMRGGDDFSSTELGLLDQVRPIVRRLLADVRARGKAPSAAVLRRHLDITPRQADVLVGVMAGESNRDIAVQLRVAPATVKKHLERLYRSLGVPGRSAASAIGWQAPASRM